MVQPVPPRVRFVFLWCALLFSCSFLVYPLYSQHIHWERIDPDGGSVDQLLSLEDGSWIARTGNTIYYSPTYPPHWEERFTFEDEQVKGVVIEGTTFYAVLSRYDTSLMDYVGRIVKSTDNGAHWNIVNNNLPSGFLFIVSKEIFLYVTEALSYGTKAVFRSTNGGVKLDTVLSLPRLKEQNTPYFAEAPDGTLYLWRVKEEGVLKSTDQGITWNLVEGTKDLNITTLFARSSNSCVVGTGDGQLLPFSETENGGDMGPGVLMEPVSHITELDGKLYVAYGGDVYVTTNGGIRWEQCFDSYRNNTIHVTEDSQHNLITCSGLGILEWDAANSAWVPRNDGIRNLTSYQFAVSAQGEQWLATSGGLWMRESDALPWELTSGYNITTRFVNVVVKDDAAVYATTWTGRQDGNQMARSYDKGKTWSDYSGESVNSVLFDTYGNDWIACARGVSRSSDDGNKWERMYDEFPTFESRQASTLLKARDGSLLVNTADGLFHSTDQGEIWKNAFPPYTRVLGLAMDSSGLIYTFLNKRYSPSSLLYYSMDNGVTWIQSKDSISNQGSYQVNAPFAIIAGQLFLSTPIGLMRSKDKGDSWENVNGGVLTGTIHSVVATEDGTLYVSTDHGLFKSHWPASVGVKASVAQTITVNPNPIVNTTVVTLQLIQPERLTIELYDVLGRKVALLYDENLSQGVQHVSVNLGSISQGSYSLVIKSGSTTQSRQILKVSSE